MLGRATWGGLPVVLLSGSAPLPGREPATLADAPDLLFALVLGLTGLTVVVLVLTGLSAAIRLRHYRLFRPSAPTQPGNLPSTVQASEQALHDY